MMSTRHEDYDDTQWNNGHKRCDTPLTWEILGSNTHFVNINGNAQNEARSGAIDNQDISKRPADF